MTKGMQQRQRQQQREPLSLDKEADTRWATQVKQQRLSSKGS